MLAHELDRAAPVRHRRAFAGFLDGRGGERLLERDDELLNLVLLFFLPCLAERFFVEAFAVLGGRVLHEHVVALSFERAEKALNRVPRRVLSVEIDRGRVDFPLAVLEHEVKLLSVPRRERRGDDGRGGLARERVSHLSRFLRIVLHHAAKRFERSSAARFVAEQAVRVVRTAVFERARVFAQRRARVLRGRHAARRRERDGRTRENGRDAREHRASVYHKLEYEKTVSETLPILPLRNSVVFPASVVPINVGRMRSVRLVEELEAQERAVVGIVSQRDGDVDEPGWEDVYEIGTVARVVKVIRLGAQNYSVVLHGLSRMKMIAPVSLEPYMRAKVERIAEDLERDAELDALGTRLRDSMREVLELTPNLPKEVSAILDNVRESGALADLVASNFGPEQATVEGKQKVLETFDAKTRVGLVLAMAEHQLDVLRVRREVSTMVEDEGKTQREQILRQQMKNIREELGEAGEEDEVEELRERLRRAGLSDDAQKIARKQLSRLAGMQQQSAEYNVTRTYLEWLADLPWSKTTQDKLDPQDVRRCLDEDHFGLEKVKKRIVEYIAVRKLKTDTLARAGGPLSARSAAQKQSLKGPILCFIGPPGVGKTSLGRSIARSMGRRYHRIALGGVRDEAEIRGHRRTYVGALPGRIMQGLKKVAVKNPVLVLDEIDKMGVDMMGDPAAALLEVLDPAQNNSFQDHYVDTPFDLSQVTFLATANNPDTIPPALWDRLEVIEVPGYTRNEKRSIAHEFLIPKQLSSHGLTDERLEFTREGTETIIDRYTREAGVRGLEREIGSVCRAVAMRIAEGETDVHAKADAAFVEKVLGPPRFSPDLAERTMSPGVATGLAWTPSGGDILFIEASSMPGKGSIMVTGNLKSVMQESAHTALSYVRSKTDKLKLDPEFLKAIDLHVHVPKGGTPKDGPSAGVTIFAAVASLLLKWPLKRDVAMTGEITLRGAVMPVGGIKEKLLAAHRAGITEVLVPARNESDLDEVPKDVRDSMKIHLVKRVDEVLALVLDPTATPDAPVSSSPTPPAP